jgi:hypothetical protein
VAGVVGGREDGDMRGVTVADLVSVQQSLAPFVALDGERT